MVVEASIIVIGPYVEQFEVSSTPLLSFVFLGYVFRLFFKAQCLLAILRYLLRRFAPCICRTLALFSVVV